MSEKRQRQYDRDYDNAYSNRSSGGNRHGHGHGQPFQKRHKPNNNNNSYQPSHSPHRSERNGSERDPATGFSNVSKSGFQPVRKGDVAAQALQHIDRLPDPRKCEPCKLAAEETRTGLIALLDQLEQEEEGGDGDAEILLHARELRLRLAERQKEKEKEPGASKAKQKLEEKYPGTVKYVELPSYIARKIELSKDLPPLPPITEPWLKESVFTHKSTTTDPSVSEKVNYERLEFLGDAYIEIIATRIIFTHFSHLETGQQAALRESIVKNETLAQLSNAYGFGDRIAHVGHLQQEKGWTKILADVFEAYVAAIILSDPATGFATAETWLSALWSSKLLSYKEKPLEDPNAREEIRRLLAGKGVLLEYKMERNMEQIEGVQRFYMGLYLTGWGFRDEWLGSGEGQNKAQACVYAAMDALKNRKAVVDEGWRRKLEMYPHLKEKVAGGGKQEKEQGKESKSGEGDGGAGEDVEKKKKKKNKDRKAEKSGSDPEDERRTS